VRLDEVESESAESARALVTADTEVLAEGHFGYAPARVAVVGFAVALAAEWEKAGEVQ
jgi:hypothetical protein